MSYENINGEEVEYIDEDFAGRAKRASRWLWAYRTMALASLGIAVINPLITPAMVIFALLTELMGQKQYRDIMSYINEDKEIVEISEQENRNGDGI